MTSERPLAVVLASGGMDSCVAAAWAAQRFRLAMLHVNYGQRTEAKELECFRRLAEHFRAERSLVAEARYLKEIGASSLTDPRLPVPEDDTPGEIPSTYVPFRNANLLAIAVAWAEAIGPAPSSSARSSRTRRGIPIAGRRSTRRPGDWWS